jgi:membrane protein implicated in regulation of membrane protease activity
MATWIFWLIIGVVLAGAEVFTLTAVLGLLGGAALLTAGSALLGLPLAGQFLVFSGAAVAGLVVVRPLARALRGRPAPERFGVDALAGRSAHVLHQVTGRTGLVRIGGEDWTARAFEESLVIPAGSTVDVLRIDGTTAVVYPRE